LEEGERGDGALEKPRSKRGGTSTITTQDPKAVPSKGKIRCAQHLFSEGKKVGGWEGKPLHEHG